MVRKQWIRIPVTGITSGEIEPKVEFKIPAHVKCVHGIMVSAVDPNAAPTQEIIGSAAKDNHLGDLSLHFNGKKEHPIKYRVKIKAHANLDRKYEKLRLDSALVPNALVSGYYIDLGNAPRYPYTLNIYLYCTTNIPVEKCLTV